MVFLGHFHLVLLAFQLKFQKLSEKEKDEMYNVHAIIVLLRPTIVPICGKIQRRRGILWCFQCHRILIFLHFWHSSPNLIHFKASDVILQCNVLLAPAMVGLHLSVFKIALLDTLP